MAVTNTRGPTDNEVKDIQEALVLLENLWMEIELSIMPDACVLFDHTLEQVDKFNGIADKVEDFIERAHQIGLKWNHYTAILKCNKFEKKQELQIKNCCFTITILYLVRIKRLVHPQRGSINIHIYDNRHSRRKGNAQGNIKERKSKKKPL